MVTAGALLRHLCCSGAHRISSADGNVYKLLNVLAPRRVMAVAVSPSLRPPQLSSTTLLLSFRLFGKKRASVKQRGEDDDDADAVLCCQPLPARKLSSHTRLLAFPVQRAQTKPSLPIYSQAREMFILWKASLGQHCQRSRAGPVADASAHALEMKTL